MQYLMPEYNPYKARNLHSGNRMSKCMNIGFKWLGSNNSRHYMSRNRKHYGQKQSWGQSLDLKIWDARVRGLSMTQWAIGCYWKSFYKSSLSCSLYRQVEALGRMLKSGFVKRNGICKFRLLSEQLGKLLTQVQIPPEMTYLCDFASHLI